MMILPVGLSPREKKLAEWLAIALLPILLVVCLVEKIWKEFDMFMERRIR